MKSLCEEADCSVNEVNKEVHLVETRVTENNVTLSAAQSCSYFHTLKTLF